MTEIARVTITEEECLALHRAFFELQALRNILNDIKPMEYVSQDRHGVAIVVDRVVAAYGGAQVALNRAWGSARVAHFGAVYESDECQSFCRFDTREVTIDRVA